MLPRIKLLIVPVAVFLILPLTLVSLLAQQQTPTTATTAQAQVLWEFDTGG